MLPLLPPPLSVNENWTSLPPSLPPSLAGCNYGGARSDAPVAPSWTVRGGAEQRGIIGRRWHWDPLTEGLSSRRIGQSHIRITSYNYCMSIRLSELTLGLAWNTSSTLIYPMLCVVHVCPSDAAKNSSILYLKMDGERLCKGRRKRLFPYRGITREDKPQREKG